MKPMKLRDFLKLPKSGLENGAVIDGIFAALSQREFVARVVDEMIEEIDQDERFHYKPALVQVNAPLALIQMGMEGQMKVLKKIKSILKKEGE